MTRLRDLKGVVEAMAQSPEERFDDKMDGAFPVKADQVHLRLVKTHDAEVICDQDGRELSGVVGFRYEQTEVMSVPILTIKLYVKPSDWEHRLGVVKAGDEPSLEPVPL